MTYGVRSLVLEIYVTVKSGNILYSSVTTHSDLSGVLMTLGAQQGSVAIE
jgi:hypothetical protein